MSELINNSEKRKSLLKHMIKQLHEGVAPEEVKARLAELLTKIPYGEVVEVEQELINEGLPTEEVLKLCDVHAQVLDGNIDQSGARVAPPGHPVDTFLKENIELKKIVGELEKMYEESENLPEESLEKFLLEIKGKFNLLWDVDKHYRKKENLLFPYMENYGITGPPKVMWGKHDEARELLKAACETLEDVKSISKEEFSGLIDLVFRPASNSVVDMINREEEILFPMTMDKLTDIEWYEIYKQTNEIGYCLYDPKDKWEPEGIEETFEEMIEGDNIILPSGKFQPKELLALLNTLPIDMTFVDKDDKVKYFSQGKHRIFDRNRAILGRDVKLCHPPSSVDIVDKILQDFKSGKESHAPFWIQMGGKFIHIEYFALRDEKGEYLGCLEVSQDLTDLRALEGEQRLLEYSKG